MAAETRAVRLFPDCGPNCWLFVAGEIVEDDDVAFGQCRAQLLLNPSREAGTVDRLIEDERRIDPVTAQGSDESHRLPMTIRNLGMKPLALGCPASQRRHVGFRPRFIDENQPRGVRALLILPPLLAPLGHLWAELFGGKNAFF